MGSSQECGCANLLRLSVGNKGVESEGNCSKDQFRTDSDNTHSMPESMGEAMKSKGKQNLNTQGPSKRKK